MHARLESHLIDKLLETFSIATMYSSDGGQVSARGHQVNAGVPSVRPVSGIPEAGEQKKSKQSDSLLELLDPDGQTLACQGVTPGWIIVGNTLQLVQKK